jgi:Domain of unknown function (DUF4301)
MFTEKDLQQLNKQQVSQADVAQQIQHFIDGFPYLRVLKAATVGDGIIRINENDLQTLIADFENYTDVSMLKFVPASGAATRMFKSLFSFRDDDKSDKSIPEFCERIQGFAFYEELKNTLPDNTQSTDYKTITDYLLSNKGLDYGQLPKGLLTFHRYETTTRKAIEEHLVEGALYANVAGIVRLHFTVSPEHRSRFEALINQVIGTYEQQYNLKYDISFSEQKPSTDTISVDINNEPFRNADGSLLFRPAGHGALLANLNDQDGDVVFIKNVDNVVPDSLKTTTIAYKKALAALLLKYRQQIIDFQTKITQSDAENSIEALTDFYKKTLCTIPPQGFSDWTNAQKLVYFKTKLDRPVRVCGMVKNVGEPGGGPFWAANADGTTSLQVVESAQIDLDDIDQKNIFETATHFNPVDLICSLRGYNNKKFDLMNYRDMATGFITQKSKDGRDLKAQELPGLWNGSMSDWNTVFVEVPLITFNPVKTVNDLLRPEHQ